MCVSLGRGQEFWDSVSLGHAIVPLPEVDRIWSIWESDYSIPRAIFYLLNRDYKHWGLSDSLAGSCVHPPSPLLELLTLNFQIPYHLRHHTKASRDVPFLLDQCSGMQPLNLS